MNKLSRSSFFIYPACKDEKGISLVELLIALALFSLVLSVGYSFYSFGVKSFATGETRAQVQHALHMVADFITKEVRRATVMEILGSSYTIPESGSIPVGEVYIFINNDGYLERRDTSTSNVLPFGEGLILSLVFNKSPSNERLLNFKVKETSNSLEIITDVFILNLFGNIAGTSDGTAIRFKLYTGS